MDDQTRRTSTLEKGTEVVFTRPLGPVWAGLAGEIIGPGALLGFYLIQCQVTPFAIVAEHGVDFITSEPA
jgi:hypothetical protein